MKTLRNTFKNFDIYVIFTISGIVIFYAFAIIAKGIEILCNLLNNIHI